MRLAAFLEVIATHMDLHGAMTGRVVAEVDAII